MNVNRLVCVLVLLANSYGEVKPELEVVKVFLRDEINMMYKKYDKPVKVVHGKVSGESEDYPWDDALLADKFYYNNSDMSYQDWISHYSLSWHVDEDKLKGRYDGFKSRFPNAKSYEEFAADKAIGVIWVLGEFWFELDGVTYCTIPTVHDKFYDSDDPMLEKTKQTTGKIFVLEDGVLKNGSTEDYKKASTIDRFGVLPLVDSKEIVAILKAGIGLVSDDGVIHSVDEKDLLK